MEKNATLNLRINPELKKDAEFVLTKLGIPMSVAVDMFLNQVVLSGGIPFSVSLPKAPTSVDATKMSTTQIHTKISKGYKSYKEGRVKNATEAFDKFKEKNF